MCIATVYNESTSGEKDMIMEDVVSLDRDGNSITVRSLLGEVKTLPASIKHIDFVKHTVTLAANS